MLVLSRGCDMSICIGSDITVRVLEITSERSSWELKPRAGIQFGEENSRESPIPANPVSSKMRLGVGGHVLQSPTGGRVCIDAWSRLSQAMARKRPTSEGRQAMNQHTLRVGAFFKDIEGKGDHAVATWIW